MINILKRQFIENIKNIPGWRTNRKIVVIESDDWGSIRLTDKGQRDSLLDAGILKYSNDNMGLLDALESPDDLSMLFETLNTVRDSNGNSAVITPFFNMGNPDFELIEEESYRKYHYLNLEDTFRKFGEVSILSTYKSGITEKLFLPQLHGREHVNVQEWMRSLQVESSLSRSTFSYNYSTVSEYDTPKYLSGFRATYFMNDESEIDFNLNSLKDAVNEFVKLFNYQPTVFDAPNAIFHTVLEKHLAELGVKNIVTPHYRNEPDFKGGIKKHGRYYFGQKNKHGQLYHVRNCMFEPYKGVTEDTPLRMIKTCFRWNKPAVISTHRVNYVSRIDSRVRDNSLKCLSSLLKNIVKKWPDVEFMSSAQLSKLMHKEIK